MLHPVKILIAFFFTCFILLSCEPHRTHLYTIGFSQCTGNDLWRKQMINEMKIEAFFHDNVRLVIEDARGSSALQVKQIQKLLDKKVDLLIISPNESSPITPIAERAYDKGVPTIIIDRKINSEKYTAYVGADNYAIGKYAAMFLGNKTRKKMNILEIWGLEGSSPAQERHQGFADQIKSYPNLEIIGKVQGKWLKQEAFEKVLQMPEAEKADIIFGHNEEMAMGAFEAFQKRNIDVGTHVFLGVDALQGKNGGIQAVIDKKLTATLLYPTGGGTAIQVAMLILESKEYQKQNILNTAIIDSTNAPILKLQSAQINDYLGKIETQIRNLASLDNKFQNQHTLLYISLTLMLLAFILVVMLFLAFRHTRKILKELKIKNEEISEQREELTQQREQLVQMNRQIEEVTTQKLRFFTNVSHEIRTPLSLLVSPLQTMMELNEKVELKRELAVINNNVGRLLRLINQMLDFKKIEDGQMELYVSKVDISQLIMVVKSIFDYQVQIKGIEFSIEAPSDAVEVYCDQDKIEKVLYNLISNAIKFTGKKGIIRILLTEDKDEILIKISDTGKGIRQEEISKIFDRFYQGEGDYSSGTGIGLNLSKEFVDLHKGKIMAESKPGEGSVFTVCLKKGTDHLKENYIKFVSETEIAVPVNFNREYDATIYNSGDSREESILVVEDDDDLREYLTVRLRNHYLVHEATNGREALLLLKSIEVSLIVCDVMMPEMDGFEFCHIIKEDISFSHIPIVMLTALAGEEQLIKGLTSGADDYLYKPFNTRHLELKIKNILSSRKKLRESFRQQFFEPAHETEIQTADNRFIKKVTDLLDKYIHESEISVGKISLEMGLSRIHLYRKMKEVTGTSPSEFFGIYKIKKSIPLLKAKELSISEIAYECGFSSPAYFSKCFRELLKKSPKEFQSETEG